jgi:molecular chaperone GrpE
MIDEQDDEDQPRNRGNDDDGGPSDPDDIEILGFEAADEAGVRLKDTRKKRVPAPEPEYDLDMDAEELDTSGGGSVSSPGELEAARAQVHELREQVVRTAADFDNFRKRVERDRIEERKQATAGLVRNLLPVLDAFRWAVSQASKSEDASTKGFVDGMRLVESQLFDILKSAGLEPVEASGPFDPTVHEALMQEATTEVPHMNILEVFEPGYRLGGRLLRPARVKVASNPGGASDGDGSGGSSEAESATTH